MKYVKNQFLLVFTYFLDYNIIDLYNYDLDKVYNLIKRWYFSSKCENTDFINNTDYKYKTIITTSISIVVLIYEKDIRVFGTMVDFIVDYKSYYDVYYIGYIENNNDVVVIKVTKFIFCLIIIIIHHLNIYLRLKLVECLRI